MEKPDEVLLRSPGDLLAATTLVRPVDIGADAHGRSLLQITSALAQAVATEDVYRAIVDHVAVALGASTCALWLYDGSVLRLVRQVGYLQHTVASLAEIRVAVAPAMPIIDAVRFGEPVWIASQRALLHAYPHLATEATRGRSYRISCLPLVIEAVVLGALAITLDEERESTESERSFLLLVARYASQALERLRMLEAERTSRQRADVLARRMHMLSHASRAFGAVDVGYEQRLRDIARELGTLLDGATTIELVHEAQRLQRVSTYHPDSEADTMTRALAVRLPLGDGEGVSGHVLQTGTSVLLSEIDPATLVDRAPPADRAFFARFPIYAAMIAPLRVRGHVFGTVSVTRVRMGQRFDADDLELLENLADRAASAIENSRLHHEAEAARARAEQLYAFASAAVAAQTLPQVFEAALDAIAGVLQTTRAAILLFDDTGVMRFRAWRNLSPTYREAVDGHSPWARDAHAPEPVLVDDCRADPAWAEYSALFEAEGIGALAFIPLVSRGRLVGKFMAYYDARHAFTRSDVDVSRAIANHLASMIARFDAVAELERTIRDNELFAGVLAHDLRNPLAAIMTAAQLAVMHGDAASEHINKPMARILSATERMSRMIEQLLDFTRARHGDGIEVRPQPTSLADITRQAVGELELVHAQRTFALEVHGEHHGVWDPDRLLQAVSNLVANACRHGAAGSAIKLTIDGNAPKTVALTVHNAGAISPSLLPHIFEPFRGRVRRNGDGLGLGLYIVRAIVRAHLGTVDVHSNEADGTTFIVQLPRG
ncbi:MAG TPA: GAF domain-containing protein [Kofleriaceae bacterium]|nr:GAF domain-containing protein [Kofleriaceae bacterium]